MHRLPFFLIALILTLSFGVLAPRAAMAACAPGSSDVASCITQGISDSNGGKSSTISFGTSLGFSSLNQTVSTLIALLFVGSGLVAFFYILRGAMMYVTAGEDSGQTGKARIMMTNAVIGLFVLALVWVIWVFAINLIPGMSDFFSVSNPGSNIPSDCASQRNTAC